MASPNRIMGKGTNEGIQAQVDTEGNLHVTNAGVIKTAGYKISDTDLASSTQYFGFVKHDGSYYIMQRNKLTGAWRYSAGTSGYALAWTNRTTETYNYYYTEF